MIEVRGVNTHNKGAHLMMLAVAQELTADNQLTMSPNGADFAARSAAGYQQTFVLNQAPGVTRVLGSAIPSGLRRAFGLVADNELTGVLDAAGFAYSDSFSPARAEREARLAVRWSRRGLPHVFLPQAFGPFTKPDQRRWSKSLLNSASLIFARDKVSLAFVQELGISSEVRLAPDFTVGLDVSAVPSQYTAPYAAIVPNEKLVTQGKVSQDAYVSSLIGAANSFDRAGLKPLVVIHEFNDRGIGELVCAATGAELFLHDDPMVLKRVLGDAEVAVASRFHAIVGALALGTPVAAYGWSHKYGELMEDFGFPEWVVSDSASLQDVVRILVHAGDDTRTSLAHRARLIKDQNAEMWKEVRAALRG